MATTGGRGSTRCRRSPRSRGPPRSGGARRRRRWTPGTGRGAWPGRRRAVRNASLRLLLQVPALVLLALDRLEERLEVPLPEAARAVALDDLEEHGRAVADRLGEDLQQVALVVVVDEDALLAQVSETVCHRGHALGDVVVVGVGDVEEADALV